MNFDHEQRTAPRVFNLHRAVVKALAAEDMDRLEKILSVHISRAYVAYANRTDSAAAMTSASCVDCND